MTCSPAPPQAAGQPPSGAAAPPWKGATPNCSASRGARDWAGEGRARPQRGGRRPRRFRPPSRVDVIERLDAAGLLPAITFIFSRTGCDAAVLQCLAAGLRLTTPTRPR